MASIAFFELEPWEKDYFKAKLKKHSLAFIDAPLSSKTADAAKGADILAVFVWSKVDAAILKSLPKAKFVTTMSTGFDHIDLKACAARGVVASNVPAYGSNTVAEHAFALLLAISRKILPSVERTRRGDFSLEGLRGFDLEGKTIGIVGTGRIGVHAIKYAQAFGMRVLAYDVKPDNSLAKRMGFAYEKRIDGLLGKSDIVSLHAPLTKETEHMIDKKRIGKFKRGAILINTARGGLVESEALLDGLKSGRIAFAGLDVLEEECFIREEKELLASSFRKKCDLRTALAQHMLRDHPNVIITPHNAFNSAEALQRIMDTTVENIEAFLARKPVNTLRPS